MMGRSYDKLMRMDEKQWLVKEAEVEFTFGSIQYFLTQGWISQVCISPNDEEEPVYAYAITEAGREACLQYAQSEERFRKNEERECAATKRDKRVYAFTVATFFVSLFALIKPVELDFVSLVKSVVQFFANLIH